MIHWFDEALVATSEILTEHSPATAVRARRDGVVVAATGAGGGPFNPAFVVSPPADPDGTVAWAHGLLTATGRPFCFQVAAPCHDAVAPALAARGLVQAAVMPGMARPAAGDPPPAPDGVRIEPVADEAALDSHVAAIAIGFGSSDPAPLRTVLPPTLLGDERIALFSGYADGGETPVATSVAAVAGETAVVYAVTTQEPFRRRGIGAALTWAAVAAAGERGATTVLLQASELGEPVYRRLGFETVRAHHLYVPAG